MLHFSYSTIINASIDKVWAFHEREDVLELLNAPWQPVQIVSHKGGLEIGSNSEFRLILGVVPVRWVLEHIECNKPYLFVDRQKIGPMDCWIHRHQFETEEERTRITDSIFYSIPGGSLSELALGWWVDLRLQDMFGYRHQITKEILEN